MLRLVMPYQEKKLNKLDLEAMLKEEIFLMFNIKSMNWASLLVNPDSDVYFEVTLQLFH